MRLYCILRRTPSFRDGPKDQTSDAQLRIGESRDSGFDASHRPGMTESGLARSLRSLQTYVRDLATRCARVVHLSSAPLRAWGMPGAPCTRGLPCTLY